MTRRTVLAPAKLTWSLKVGERREDGYHDLDAEMVTLDLADHLIIDNGDGISVTGEEHARAASLREGSNNLVSRALALVGRRAEVSLHKRIPLGGGLGGGSADAGAVLRWAGGVPLADAARLGGDVPFCMVGGRARVQGLGELVEPLAFEARSVVLLIPPFGVDTGAAYQALDHLRARGAGHHNRNDLTEAAMLVEPELTRWWDAFGQTSGRVPVLAGSGSTLFVEGDPGDLGLEGVSTLQVGRREGVLIAARTVPNSYGDPRDG